MIKQLIAAATLAGAILVPANTASAHEPKKATPNPFVTPDLPGCFGNLNATINHDSGIQEHGRDSKGPGYTFRNGQEFQAARSELWPIFCGPGAGVG